MSELFSYVPPEDERAALTVAATAAGRCSVLCTWSYDGVRVDLPPAKARELGQTLIDWADGAR